jgi:hypothetical protein
MGDAEKDDLRIGFDGWLKLECDSMKCSIRALPQILLIAAAGIVSIFTVCLDLAGVASQHLS